MNGASYASHVLAGKNRQTARSLQNIQEVALSDNFRWYPAHWSTGSRGYFGKLGSCRESSQNQKTDPRSDVVCRLCWQLAHSPALARSPSSFVDACTF